MCGNPRKIGIRWLFARLKKQQCRAKCFSRSGSEFFVYAPDHHVNLSRCKIVALQNKKKLRLIKIVNPFHSVSRALLF